MGQLYAISKMHLCQTSTTNSSRSKESGNEAEEAQGAREVYNEKEP